MSQSNLFSDLGTKIYIFLHIFINHVLPKMIACVPIHRSSTSSSGGTDGGGCGGENKRN
jgi:hypothetical protein